MKKIILLVVAIFAVTLSASAQNKLQEAAKFEKGKNAIGVRLGYGAEVSYQKFLKSNNRLELDLGVTNYGFNASGIYQWMWGLDIEGVGFNWYAGVGANLGAWSSSFGLGAVGQIGLEYNFKIPLALSIDWRPGFHVLPSTHFAWEGIAISARYRF